MADSGLCKECLLKRLVYLAPVPLNSPSQRPHHFVQWAHERLGIPQAQEGEAVLGDVALQPPPTGTAAATALLPATATLAPPVAMQPQLARNAAPATAGWLDQVRELVQRAQSLEEIRDGLELLLPDMSLDQYATAMAEALRAAELAGRYEVLQEAGGLHG